METRLLIGGEQVEGSGPSLEVENPFDQSPLATVGTASDEQLAAALAAAEDASSEWAHTPAVERGEMLHEAAATSLPSGPERQRAGT